MTDSVNAMNAPSPPPLTEAELHALVDGQLSAHDRAALDVRLAQDPSAQATVTRWTEQRERLRGLHARVLDEPVPATLLAAAQQTAGAHQRIQQWWKLGGMAASVALAFGGGWMGHTVWQSQDPVQVARQTPSAEFVRQARFAHVVYSPEKRHPVEVAATEREHLVQWLSKRVGRPLKVPDLQPQGYELVGGRLLPGDSGARAQFMFQNAAGVRITLYLGAMNGPNSSAPQETAFRFAADGGVPSFYWTDQGFGYALSGPLERQALMQLAETVYRQL